MAGEATYVEQIVRNLLGNAAKYAPPGTSVVVDARRNEQDVEIRVTDSGPGIPEASLRRVFELFYRDPDSARAVAGSGIGLFVCRSLVEAMGGRMWALRPPDGGTEFGFTLRVLEVDEADWDPSLDDRRPVLPVAPAPSERPGSRHGPTDAATAAPGQLASGSTFSGRCPVADRLGGLAASSAPQRASADSVAAAMCGGSISK